MHLRLLLQQSRPVLLRQLLLLQHHHHISCGMVQLGLLGLDLGIEFELDGVLGFFALAVTGEVEVAGLDVELDLLGVDVRDVDGEEDVVLLCFCAGGALGP